MNYTYTATGSIRLGGCSGYRWVKHYRFAFDIGSTVFLKPKAMKGVFEKVVIKDVRFPRKTDPTRRLLCRFCELYPIYVDTLNALFNEEELVTWEEAVELVTAYEEKLRNDLEQLALNCK